MNKNELIVNKWIYYGLWVVCWLGVISWILDLLS